MKSKRLSSLISVVIRIIPEQLDLRALIVSISIYFYGADAARVADATQNEWAAWLRDLFKGKARPA